jgi:hypothetical protein
MTHLREVDDYRVRDYVSNDAINYCRVRAVAFTLIVDRKFIPEKADYCTPRDSVHICRRNRTLSKP